MYAIICFKGEFGLIYKAQWRDVSVAIKTLRGGATENQKQNFLFEATGLFVIMRT